MNRLFKKRAKGQKSDNGDVRSVNDARFIGVLRRDNLAKVGLITGVVVVLAGIATVGYLNTKKRPDSKASQAGTTCPATTYGNVALGSVTAPATGRHKVWVRVRVPDTTNNSVSMAINSDSCYVVGDSASITPNTWVWVDYENATTSQKLIYNFSSTTGNNIVVFGREADVSVDRIIILAETDTCVPDNVRDTTTNREPGDNCQPPPADTSPPTVSLTAPAASSVQRGTFNLTATASDNVGVTKVEFYEGATKLGEDTTSPYSYSWATTAANNGTRSLTARASDAANNTTTSSTVSITVDNTNPTTSITAPTNGASVNGTVSITANASDNVAVSKVEFFRGTTKLGEDSSSPYSLSWNTTTVANGSYALTSRANDTAGNTTDSTAVNVTVNNTTPDTTAPSVPTNLRSTSTGVTSVVLAWNASTDNVGVTGYRVFRGGIEITSVTGTTYTDTGLAGSTTYSYTVSAFDVVGNDSAQTSPLSVTTAAPPDTTAPTVSLTAPANNATVSGTVNITATASDNVGVSKVEFYRGSTKLGEDTSSPYSYSWNTSSVSGTQVLTARAIDAANNQTTSTAVTVNVQNTTPPPSDTTAPSVPGGLAAKAETNGSITVTWTASTDNVAVAGYKVFRNGTQVATVGTTSYNDTQVTNGTTYSYTVSAFDSAGNNSNQSGAVSAKSTKARKKGDVNYDDKVNIFDLSILLGRWNRTDDPDSDLNSDGKTNIFDLSILLGSWGT